MGIRMMKIASFYFVIGVLMGMYMSAASNHSLTPVHVHLNLLGWVSLAISGIIYHLFPKAAHTKLGKSHFWIYNIGVPLMMLGLTSYILGFSGLIFIVPIGGVLIVVGTILFFINVMLNMKGRSAGDLQS